MDAQTTNLPEPTKDAAIAAQHELDRRARNRNVGRDNREASMMRLTNLQLRELIGQARKAKK